jgi:hypothetical protein
MNSVSWTRTSASDSRVVSLRRSPIAVSSSSRSAETFCSRGSTGVAVGVADGTGVAVVDGSTVGVVDGSTVGVPDG